MPIPPTPPQPDLPDAFSVSPKAWATISQVAFIGRIVLLPAGLLSLLATFIETDGVGALTKIFLTLLALALVTFAVLGTVKPGRVFDLVTVALALTLAGTWGFYAFASLGNEYQSKLYILQFFAWLATLGGGLAVGAVLLPGPTAAVPLKLGGASTPGPGAQQWGAPSGYAPPAQGYGPAPTGFGAPTSAPAGPPPGATSSFAPPAAPAPTPEPPAEPAVPAPTSDAPEPGWYPAPDGVNARWWDGSTWTGERRPLADFDDATGS
ncbi:DUF2510 domain-containing protein [Patulibacter sp. NPDC049589]|uniref:DUF2510 domain-containing protein n=1 Tax=Patulibacter sp. NPDC049589 TaxID=3154731 RepID=UPI00341E8AAF